MPNIQQLTETFIRDLRQAIAEEAAAAFQSTVTGRVVSAKTRVQRAPRAPRVLSAKRAKGAKRSPAELEKLVTSTLSAVKARPGIGVEELAKGLGVSTKDLALPIGKLRESKQLRTTGTRRGMRYFPK